MHIEGEGEEKKKSKKERKPRTPRKYIDIVCVNVSEPTSSFLSQWNV